MCTYVAKSGAEICDARRMSKRTDIHWTSAGYPWKNPSHIRADGFTNLGPAEKEQVQEC